MKSPDGSNKPLPPNNFGEPYSKDRYRFVFDFSLLEELRDLVLERKFGKAFLREYKDHRLNRELEDENGNVRFDDKKPNELLEALARSLDRERQTQKPLLPAVETLINQLNKCKTVAEIFEIAAREGCPLTKEDADQAKMSVGKIMNGSRRDRQENR